MVECVCETEEVWLEANEGRERVLLQQVGLRGATT